MRNWAQRNEAEHAANCNFFLERTSFPETALAAGLNPDHVTAHVLFEVPAMQHKGDTTATATEICNIKPLGFGFCLKLKRALFSQRFQVPGEQQHEHSTACQHHTHGKKMQTSSLAPPGSGACGLRQAGSCPSASSLAKEAASGCTLSLDNPSAPFLPCPSLLATPFLTNNRAERHTGCMQERRTFSHLVLRAPFRRTPFSGSARALAQRPQAFPPLS